MIFLPNTLEARGTANPEIRRRGIFDVLVYQADIKLNCLFSPLNQYQINNKIINWKHAKIAICLDDVRGVNNISLKIDGVNATVLAGSGELNSKYPGAHALVALCEDKPLNISLSISIKGSDTLSILPIAKDNKIELSADWPDPSLIGQFLPNTKNVTKKHFQAQWKISSLASGFPSYFDMAEIKKEIYEEKHNTFYTSLGVRFLKTADHYQQAERTTKYSFLFVLYTFLIFFLFEAVKNTKIHIFQYVITACSLLCFPLLLTSFAEHVYFEIAYGLTSLAIIIQIAFYAFGLLRKKTERFLFVGLLSSLYLYLFIVLNLEEFALLVGALGMFVAITIAMVVTKKINWFEETD